MQLCIIVIVTFIKAGFTKTVNDVLKLQIQNTSLLSMIKAVTGKKFRGGGEFKLKKILF